MDSTYNGVLLLLCPPWISLSSGQPVTYFLAWHDPKSCDFLSFVDSPFVWVTASGDKMKTSECQSIFRSLLYGEGKGGLCQKEMFVIVLINCSISPRIPWATGKSLTSAVLFYFLEAIQVCVEIHKNTNQPTSVRSIAQRVASKHPAKSCGRPLLSPGRSTLLVGTQHGKLLVDQNHMPQYFESHK